MATSGLLALPLLLAMAFHGFAWAQGASSPPSMAPVLSSAGATSMAPGPSSAGTPSLARGPSSAGAHSMAPAPSSAEAPSMAPEPFSAGAPSLAPGPGASTDCMTILVDKLSQCLTYVEAGSNLTKPDKGCCGGFAAVVKGEPICLCSLLSASDVYGVKIDRRKAFMLPTVCKVKTPPVSLCSVVGAPVSSPQASTSGTAPVGSPGAGAGGTAAGAPSGNGVDPGFRPSALALLTGLAFLAVGVFF